MDFRLRTECIVLTSKTQTWILEPIREEKLMCPFIHGLLIGKVQCDEPLDMNLECFASLRPFRKYIFMGKYDPFQRYL